MSDNTLRFAQKRNTVSRFVQGMDQRPFMEQYSGPPGLLEPPITFRKVAGRSDSAIRHGGIY